MKIKIVMFLVFLASQVFSQDLEDLVESTPNAGQDQQIDIFRGNRLGNGHTTKLSHEGELILFVSHRFGELKGGLYELFGLDQATMRFGFDYGFSDRFNLGFGRSTYQKTYDLFAKYKLNKATEQRPFESTIVGGFSVPTIKNVFPEGDDDLGSRSTLWLQFLLATQLETVSLQLMPTYLKSAYLPETGDANSVFSLGAGASARVSKMVSLGHL